MNEKYNNGDSDRLDASLDSDVRALFEAQKKTDELLLPSFATLWSSAVEQVHSRKIAPWWRHRPLIFNISAGFATVLVLAAGLFFLSRFALGPADNHRFAEAEVITNWESPTTALLSGTGESEAEDTAGTTALGFSSLITWEAPTDALVGSGSTEKADEQSRAYTLPAAA